MSLYCILEAIRVTPRIDSKVLRVMEKTGHFFFVLVRADPNFYDEINSSKVIVLIHLLNQGGMVGLVYELFCDCSSGYSCD